MAVWESALEGMGINKTFWKGKRVLLTGHTGFKGSWLTLWLLDMGAEVYGISLAPVNEPNLFTVAEIEKVITGSTIADIRDAVAIHNAVQECMPDIIIHMAAQPLVRHSYANPSETYAVNVMGTVNIFEAARQAAGIKAVVNVTTDKCYENKEWIWPYRENEPLGGYDPYSSSKACSELVTAAYRRSFLEDNGVEVATARAGNVIGGGDWADNRLVPDFFRASDSGKKLSVRFPDAVRPWQHALDPLAGYLMLAEKLCDCGRAFAGAWNLGSDEIGAKSVQWIVAHLCRAMPGTQWETASERQLHEAHTLKLDSSKAKSLLGWYPRWSLAQALDKTVAWHQAWKKGRDMSAFCLHQIHEYEKAGQA